ncbi:MULTISPECIES: MFS transporter [unclassified Sphingomonas]|uniref:MFS transporter n=1 Tax=unclassified Sphingomonas TaxID=196159 RepID=UPI0006FD1257|nr:MULTISPECIES: MFS transporter [unclassified Sphingomonas]KQX23561.1 hypothetical protein ASD17_04530 [Sphingomonas sp. Root1294]KQY68411.1 hypothetical protein ASD39_07050 [Sphingomonas sp. Root50]KRB91314.1 hypothetical protein ASE22_13860 [Sphingomonas sp. Root720]
MTDPGQRRFLWLYPLANAGAYIAFLPLLTIILPLRAEALAGEAKVTLLSEALLAGVLVATIANVAAGMASDWTRARIGTRMPWLWAGLAGTWLSYAVIATASEAVVLGIGLMLFQLFFNMFFGPLGALLADKVPDHLKGRVSGLANLALPAGTLASGLVGLPLFATDGARLIAVTMLTAALVLPLLIAALGHWRDVDTSDDPHRRGGPLPQRGWRAFFSLWVAKCLVQLSGNVMTSYFLFYLKDEVFRGDGPSDISAQTGFAGIIVIATFVGAVTSIGAGRWSDRSGRRRPFLLGAVALMMVGLSALLIRSDWVTALFGYTVFVAGLGSFLTIDIALVAQILPSDRHRGRDLGIMNAANTVPAILAPALALTLFDQSHDGYGLLFAFLLLALAGSGGALLTSRSLR